MKQYPKFSAPLRSQTLQRVSSKPYILTISSAEIVRYCFKREGTRFQLVQKPSNSNPNSKEKNIQKRAVP